MFQQHYVTELGERGDDDDELLVTQRIPPKCRWGRKRANAILLSEGGDDDDEVERIYMYIPNLNEKYTLLLVLLHPGKYSKTNLVIVITLRSSDS